MTWISFSAPELAIGSHLEIRQSPSIFNDILRYGYGSIPMKIPFLGGWTSILNPAILMWTTGVLLVLTHPNILQTYSYPIPVQNMSPRTVVADRCRKNLLVQGFVELEPVGRGEMNIYPERAGKRVHRCRCGKAMVFPAKSSTNGWFSTSSCQFRLGYVRKSNSFGEKG